LFFREDREDEYMVMVNKKNMIVKYPPTGTPLKKCGDFVKQGSILPKEIDSICNMLDFIIKWLGRNEGGFKRFSSHNNKKRGITS
jgi:hypothetical protein